MRKWLNLLVLLFICVLLASGCSKKKKETPEPAPESKTVDLGESGDDDKADKVDKADKKSDKKADKRRKHSPKSDEIDPESSDRDREIAAKNDAASKNPDGSSKRGKPAAELEAEAEKKADEKPEAKPEPAPEPEGLDFSDEAETQAAAAPRPPRQPKPRDGMNIEKLINIRELREQTGYSGVLQDAWLVGQAPDSRYNAMRLATDNADDLGFAVQVWKPGNETAASKRFADLYAQSFGGRKIKNVATDAFIASHHKINEIGFFDKSKRATVLISCSDSVCTPEQIQAVAQIIQRRI